MQRRLTFAIVGVALAAIVLVGLGVLGFAQVGATSRARTAVEARLEAIGQLIDTDIPVERAGPAILQLGDSFSSGTVQFATLTPSGELRGPGRRNEGNRNLRIPLDPDQVAVVAAGEPLVYRTNGVVRGVQRLELDDRAGAAVVIVEQPIARLGAETRVWFVISAGLVLAGAVIVSSLLARRFSVPVLEATATTSAIADGDLGARMRVEGSDEFATLGTSINRMAGELERGRAAEQQFLLSVSHDLRTPLTAISGYAEALTDGAVRDPALAGEIIGNHAERLDRLVRDLLDLAKLDTRQFRFETTRLDAAAVVSRTVAGLTPDARHRGLDLRFESDGPALIDADADRLGQAVANLVENASKFANSTVHVAVSGSRPDRVTIAVEDDGPGIAPDDLPHVFERLYVTRAQPRRSESSTGLGLAIVRELTAAMGGTVRAESGSGTLGGAVLTLEFPLGAPSTGHDGS